MDGSQAGVPFGTWMLITVGGLVLVLMLAWVVERFDRD